MVSDEAVDLDGFILSFGHGHGDAFAAVAPGAAGGDIGAAGGGALGTPTLRRLTPR